MSAQHRHRGLTLLLAIVPGWGHVYWGRERLGLAVFTLGALFGFAFLNALFVYHGDAKAVLEWVFGVLFALVWVSCFADICLRTSARRARRDSETIRMLLDQGTIAYLHSDFAKAKECFLGALRIRPQNVDAMFRLGIVCTRAGEAREGRRWLRLTLRYDLEDKWRWEVERELKRLERDKRSGSEPNGRDDGPAGGAGGAAPAEKKEETERASA